ncbi:RNA polymerase sigma factor [Microbacterium sp. SS28]|uniref:RNA polymerase sigma factor n=1 Tax=Microbacterium sp. SS28 TaxID=2919948 RepID=UPI001FAA2585|nr:sigma-70 family RNA polymerase sigma factor [Microbacterium sp. SS28]
MSPDNEVIETSIAEPAIFADLYDRHARSVFRYAAQRVGDHAAEDIMSDTFVVAFEKRRTYDTAVPDARPWLLGIATRLIRRHTRLEAVAWKGMTADLAGRIAPDFVDQAHDRIDAQRLVHRLDRALTRLRAEDRDTLLLYAWADLDYAAIAGATNVPIGTVRSRLNRVRRVLRQAAGISINSEEVEHGRADPAPQHP